MIFSEDDLLYVYDFGEVDKKMFPTIDNLRKAAIKARKKYENKFDGYKLRNNIFRYLFSIGFRTEDIYVVLDEMEWDDE